MPIVTYDQLIASRVRWENAYSAGSITRDQYMELYNAYVAFYADLNNQQTYAAYNSALTKHGFGTILAPVTPPVTPGGGGPVTPVTPVTPVEPVTPVTPQHTLLVDSAPQYVTFTINDMQVATPYTQILQDGVYTVTMPATTYDGSSRFQKWEDGSTNPTRTINLTADKNIKATYQATPTHTLTVDSDPQGLLLSVNDMQVTTPYSQALQEGSYTLKMPEATYDGRVFKQWEDGSTSPTRTISLAANMTLKATYQSAPVVTPVVTPVTPVEPITPVTPSQCVIQYGDWGLFNGLRNFICAIQSIPTT